MRLLTKAREVAKQLGLRWNTLKESTRKGKRFMIQSFDGKWVHFGLWPFKGQGTYLDHDDEQIREAWMARHVKIMKDGRPAFLDPTSPEYYSWNILW